MNKAEPQKNNVRLSVKITFYALLFFCLLLVFELGTRLYIYNKDQIKMWLGISRIDLKEYQIIDSKNPKQNWLLKPGYKQTLATAIDGSTKSGRLLTLEYLLKRAPQLHYQYDDIIFHVNADGYKGPELDKTRSRIKILTIGDSCTFGSVFDKYSYSRCLERELRLRGRNVEVINAGVEGYSPQNVLLRINELKSLKPDITTIYIGWNAIYSSTELKFGLEKYVYSIRFIKSAFRRFHELMVGKQQAVIISYYKGKHVDRSATEESSINKYVPSFLREVEQIVKEMRSIGSNVIIVTLPGLFTMNEIPSEKSLSVGHLPGFTDNPYILAKISEQYNSQLRRMAQQYDLRVIDLEKWAEEHLRPRDMYFVDSVHLYEEGQEMIGKFMSKELFDLATR